MNFQVVEITHGHDSEWTGVEVFATLEEAQAFAIAHYETQISDGGQWREAYDCTCIDCANGWRVPAEWWKSYEVQVWDSNDKQVTEDGK